MAVEIKRGTFSWTNYMKDESTIIANGDEVSFLGFFELFTPDIPDSPGDLEHIVSERDRLDTLAQNNYGEELLWWVIAVRNDFVLPDLDLKIGATIIIPDPDLVQSRYIRR